MPARAHFFALRLKQSEWELIGACARLQHTPPSTWARRIVLLECDRLKREYQRRKRQEAREEKNGKGQAQQTE